MADEANKNVTANPNLPTILVTGDVVVDHHLYIGCQPKAVSPGADDPQTIEHIEFGGAALIERLLQPGASVAPAPWRVLLGLKKEQERYSHSFAIWEPTVPIKPLKDVKRVWLAREAGYGPRGATAPVDDASGRGVTAPALPSGAVPATAGLPADARCPARNSAEPERTDIVVLDDSGQGFRDLSECWPGCFGDPNALPRWIVWKMAGALDGGLLWQQLRHVAGIGERLVLVVSAADLRRAGMDVTVGMSWERSALDVLQGVRDTSFAPLKECAHLIVSFPDAGALWIRHSHADRKEARARLVYDPKGGEGVAFAPRRAKAFGYQACLAAGVVWTLAKEIGRADRTTDLTDGLRRGLKARRQLFSFGHGEVKAAVCPVGFPASAIREESLAPDPDRESPFLDTEIPLDLSPEDAASWTIVQQNIKAPGAFYDTACEVARHGLDKLPSIPRLQVGAYLTIERKEIEAIRRIRRQVDEYVNGGPARQPLSLCVFGAPGAGKSYIVKQLSKFLFPDGKYEFIECNLSQLSDERDLQGAFHLVRDSVLRGITPVVFWDEFDSQEYRWLRLLLAPMQDGKFREGQIIHPIGKCIFIFAGGTSPTFDAFDKPSPGSSRQEAARQMRAFEMAKGPDFKSRIHGHLDVLGPNPRLLPGARDSNPAVDATDACFPIRRALFLRGLWGLEEEPKREYEVRLVRGLLEVPAYRHGSRSLERVLLGLASRGFPVTAKSLPTTEDLARDIKPEGACARLLQYVHAEERTGVATNVLHTRVEASLDNFAAHINAAYMSHPPEARSPEVAFAYNGLSLFYRESNRAAVRRIESVLGAAGLEIVTNGTPGHLAYEKAQAQLEERMEVAARAEHDGWCKFHRDRGWLPTESYGMPRDLASIPPRHPALVPWDDLDKVDTKYKGFDRKQVRVYLKIVYDLGLAVATEA